MWVYDSTLTIAVCRDSLILLNLDSVSLWAVCYKVISEKWYSLWVVMFQFLVCHLFSILEDIILLGLYEPRGYDQFENGSVRGRCTVKFKCDFTFQSCILVIEHLRLKNTNLLAIYLRFVAISENIYFVKLQKVWKNMAYVFICSFNILIMYIFFKVNRCFYKVDDLNNAYKRSL